MGTELEGACADGEDVRDRWDLALNIAAGVTIAGAGLIALGLFTPAAPLTILAVAGGGIGVGFGAAIPRGINNRFLPRYTAAAARCRAVRRRYRQAWRAMERACEDPSCYPIRVSCSCSP